MELDTTDPQVPIEQQAVTRLMANIKLARTDFEAFIKYVWANEPGFELADFHREAIQAYTDPTKRFVYWEAHRGSAKSLFTTAFVTFSLGQDPNHRIKLVCANDKEARKRLFEIKEQITKNPLMRICFPHLRRPKNAEWNKSRIIIGRDELQKDPSVEAMGVMSGALGSRSTLIILDDVVDLRNSILQPLLKDAVRQKVFGEIVPLLEQQGESSEGLEGRLLAVGTPWTLTDVNAQMKESSAFHLVGPHPVGKDGDIYEPIWYYKFTRKALKLLHEVLGPAEYARAYLCQALTRDTVPIQAQWIKFYDANLIGNVDDLFCLQSYDLAIEVTKESDWFAYVSILWDQKRNYIFVTDAWHDKISFDSQVMAVINNARSWNPQEIVIEKGGYQGALYSHLAERTDVALPVWQFANKGRSKERRVVEAQPLFEKGRIFFHPKFDPRTNPDIAYSAPIIDELISFPFGKWDDLVDALVQVLLTIIEMAPDINADTTQPGGDDNTIQVTII
jgi:phage terminase large subunit-like protein